MTTELAPDRSRILQLLPLCVVTLCLRGFYDTAAFYDDYRIHQAGVYFIDASELVFYAWYAFYGSVATLALATSFAFSRVMQRAVRSTFGGSETRCIWIAASFVLVASFAFSRFVLLGHPVADDEHTYDFVARTLLAGHVTNAPPPFAAFFDNQFIVMSVDRWHGKYPIGHPILLALGELVGAGSLVVPLVGAFIVWLTHRVGRELFSVQAASVGVLLLAASPHFVFTCGTRLSQPTCALAMLCALAFQLRAMREHAPKWFALSGSAWGACVLVRPLPGGLFVAGAVVALAVHVLGAQQLDRSAKLKSIAMYGGAMLPGLCVLLYVNYLQSGDVLTSGYQQVHKDMHLFATEQSKFSSALSSALPSSLGSALLRENFWLFGWVVSFAFVAFARPTRGALLFWGMIALEYGYRFVSPKTVVATTGPIYVTEVVPLFALATGDGIIRVVRWLERSGVLEARRMVIAGVGAASVIGLLMFVPPTLRAAHLGGLAQDEVYAQLAKMHVDKALVFATRIVDPAREISWAYYPPNPSPNMKDDIVFALVSERVNVRGQMFDLWGKQFPDRRAFVFSTDADGSILRELRRESSSR